MLQGTLAIILLFIAMVLYFLGRRSTVSPFRDGKQDHPDVVLGLSDPSAPLLEELEPKPASEPKKVDQRVERVMIFLRAPLGRQYGGYELWQSLLTYGLRFGEMNIFHRYEEHTNGPTILFSVAAATQTGELIPANLGDLFCSGLTLFVTLNEHLYPSVSFELMLDTARKLAEDLNGFLLDEKQKPLTQEKIQEIREKVKNFEMGRQNMELFV